MHSDQRTVRSGLRMMGNVMFSRRTTLDIMHDILQLCQIPRKKTYIMYQSNLSFYQLRKYLEMLISEKLLEELNINGRILFQATEEGKRFLSDYKRFGMIANGTRSRTNSGP